MKRIAMVLALTALSSAFAQDERPAVIFDEPALPEPIRDAPFEAPQTAPTPAPAPAVAQPAPIPAPAQAAPIPAPVPAPAPVIAQPAPTPPPAPTAQAEGDEQPAVRFDDEGAPAPQAPSSVVQPGVPAAAPRAARAEDLRDDAGTTIVGERESPIGLYITPWREAYSEQGIDRPARLLSVDLSPVDRDVFRRQLEYYRALEDNKAAKLGGRPAPAAP